MNIWFNIHSVNYTCVQGTLLIKHVVNDREVFLPLSSPQSSESPAEMIHPVQVTGVL